MTLTPPSASECRIAWSTTRGAWTAVEIISV